MLNGAGLASLSLFASRRGRLSSFGVKLAGGVGQSVRNGIWVVDDFIEIGYFSACVVKSVWYIHFNNMPQKRCAPCANCGSLCLIPYVMVM
jgi:hypothetical protein